jgi:hypothetical protein
LEQGVLRKSGKNRVLISSPLTCNVTIMSLVEMRAGRISAANQGKLEPD